MTFKLGGVTLSGVETLLFPSIHCPVITDQPLLSQNPFNLACIAVIYNEQHREKLDIFMLLLFKLNCITFCLNQ